MLPPLRHLSKMSLTAKVDASDRKGHRRSLCYSTELSQRREIHCLVFEETCGQWLLMGTINFLYGSSAPQFRIGRDIISAPLDYSTEQVV